VEVSIKNTDIHSILAGLKLLESDRTKAGHWDVARKVGRLHKELHKQVFDYSPEEDDTDE
jgi:hypothetical protein